LFLFLIKLFSFNPFLSLFNLFFIFGDNLTVIRLWIVILVITLAFLLWGIYAQWKLLCLTWFVASRLLVNCRVSWKYTQVCTWCQCNFWLYGENANTFSLILLLPYDKTNKFMDYTYFLRRFSRMKIVRDPILYLSSHNTNYKHPSVLKDDLFRYNYYLF
jgi:hypothetical protein